jgi:hypothetical protein
MNKLKGEEFERVRDLVVESGCIGHRQSELGRCDAHIVFLKEKLAVNPDDEWIDTCLTAECVRRSFLFLLRRRSELAFNLLNDYSSEDIESAKKSLRYANLSTIGVIEDTL